mgnify:CR=1 FL=1
MRIQTEISSCSNIFLEAYLKIYDRDVSSCVYFVYISV